MGPDPQRDAGGDRAYTVLELNRGARALLEAGLGGVWVEAEVTEVTRARSGHLYFTLADPDGRAQIGAVMWKGQAMRYGPRVAAGSTVRCRGRVTVYEAGGRYQIVADRIEEAGAGLRARRLAELRARLEAEGLFAPERKRPLPPVPRCVGVVTSRAGAAIRDVAKVTSRRFPVRVLLAHAQVQGAAAPSEIAAALDRLASAEGVDVVIVGRGGGSSEDLDAFNSEEVVRAVARHPRPVVSAVGHEIDITLVDLVADRRAATPSEAAEIAVPEATEILEEIAAARAALARAAGRRAGEGREALAVLDGRLRSRDPRVRLGQRREALARARESLARWPATALARARGDLASAAQGLERWPDPTLAARRADLGQLAARLDALSPLASLRRGYAVARRRRDGAVVRDAAQVPAGTPIDVVLARGALECTVDRSEAGPEEET